MPKRNIDNLVIENARIIFRNFSGKGDKFNRDGVRTFCVIIEDPDVAARMSDDSWNVKTLKPKDDGDIPVSYIQVMVSYRIYQPGVTLITSKRKTRIGEDSIDLLDYADIKSCDLVISPSEWEVNGKTGVKGYLKSLYVVIEEDEFADKYQDIPE